MRDGYGERMPWAGCGGRHYIVGDATHETPWRLQKMFVRHYNQQERQNKISREVDDIW
ncbi:protein of unknown function [Methanoculleus bourgensis]|uniref:Uncharacterized protein n=1 Tax=Methanoculleus bourgensis TaxID=83986 RepID=A0A0X3BHC2_9EURY|nr:protein of unknown function [Methanoculleus bourgensis]